MATQIEVQSFDDQKDAIKAEQSGLSKEEVMELMQQRNDFILELDNLKPQKHIWVDRGLVMSCEGAAHQHHQVFKRRR